jgi:hypothetical protein
LTFWFANSKFDPKDLTMNRNFKHLSIYLFLIAQIFLFAACDKDDDNDKTGQYYFRFSANGTMVEFNHQLLLTAGFGQSPPIYAATASGANDATTNISLIIYNNGPIVADVYSGYDIVEGEVIGVIIAYLDKKTGVVFGSGGGPDVDATVEITELTATYMKGKFNGTVVASGQDDIAITNGSFYVRRVN